MENIKINNTHRARILEEHGKVLLQTKTPAREKFLDAVKDYKETREKVYEIVKSAINRKISDSEMSTFRKFKRTDEQISFRFDMIDAIKDKRITIDFASEVVEEVGLQFDNVVANGHIPFVLTGVVPASFMSERKRYKAYHELHNYLKDNSKEFSGSYWHGDKAKENRYKLEYPNLDYNMEVLNHYKKEQDVLVKWNDLPEKLKMLLEKYGDEFYTNQTKMREYLKTCKTLEDVIKVWNDFNYTILNEKAVGTSLSIVSAELVDDLKKLHELRA